MIYVFQVIIYSAILWFLYLLLLRDKPMHGFNRVYLLMASALPIALPFITLPESTPLEAYRQEYISIRLPEITISDSELASNAMTLGTWLLIGYAVISAIVIVFHIRQWWQINQVIRKGEKQKENGYILLLNTGYGPGSWGKNIFLPENEIDNRILQHELAHICLHHTRDTVWMMFLQSFFWFNPFLYFIRKELRIVHEYQADALATDKADYGNLLLAHALDTCMLPIAHSFFHHPIKRRIMMLNKKLRKPSLIMRSSIVAACSILFITSAIAVQSCKEKEFDLRRTSEERASNKDQEFNPHIMVMEDGDDSDSVKMPVFPGERDALVKFMIANLKYPEEAMKKKSQGRVLVKFVVLNEGTISKKEIVSSPDTLLSQAALDVIDKMPKWIPGENSSGKTVSVSMTLPVSFKL